MKETEEQNALQNATFEELVREMLTRIGEDPEREGLVATPGRVQRAWEFLSRGYNQSVDTLLIDALLTVEYNEMVIVKDIEMFSMCEHHLLPFFGKVHVAYIPNGKVIGLSKIPRLVDMFARRLQVQERLTTELADAIVEAIKPQGVGVVVEARHLCMMMRGVEKQHSSAVTSAMRGTFLESKSTREEFLSLLRQKQSNGF
jgi:GTP cyclohydrolase I